MASGAERRRLTPLGSIHSAVADFGFSDDG
jgi:hypothetical protein